MRKKILNIINIFILLFLAQSAIGQNGIKLYAIDYLIKVGDLKPIDDKQKYFNNIFIVDLLKSGEIANKETCIFRFGTFADHSKTYLLLKDGQNFQVLGLQKLDEDLLIELSFLKKHNITPTECLKYIEATIIEYQKNLNVIPWTDL